MLRKNPEALWHLSIYLFRSVYRLLSICSSVYQCVVICRGRISGSLR
ncbi:hypothetical protein ACPOL_5716 [Acidisarcina polymorpha]|uniref:Uncharacterized protein n=1 Tax=Acidisarcina polymorpha TaxID=2211140 RepID=A0A2Z5G6T8_9BACT|nr:hypothetical protein ACPOL_5716 [Acidisarcina polymorpha]